MSLMQAMSVLMKRDLDKEEVSSLIAFQRLYKIGDDDPIIVVLALMARNQLIIDKLPTLLEETAKATIELHRQTLSEQSTIIAKDLVLTLAPILKQSDASNKSEVKDGIYRYIVVFGGGALFSALLTFSIIRFFH